MSGSTALKVHPPRKWIWFVLEGTIEAKGVQAAIAQYQELRTEHGDEYNFAEYELEHVGYDLLGKRKHRDAIAILRSNAAEYPASFNVYDSLGDAYLQAGDKPAAEQSFRRSLQIYPAADNYSHRKLDALHNGHARDRVSPVIHVTAA